ncbi:uncharacterized protein LOC132948083 isoform X1 [Metopolophium dirhodum]|uniref:uncharacterized protein LOC132948083 isoform X1 n=1 Tax=Metopolophium dirhodum TaxID=44670 RepID=UPI00298FD001|nr:uncharacterized protein LOC132948083 isoform X1 [Metopolophium dirhodum]
MVLSCSVQNCENKLIKGNGIIFHRLPLHDKELLKKWLKALKIDNCTPTKYYNVCSEHFTENDYKKQPTGVKLAELLCSAVPSIFSDSSNSKQNLCSFTNKRKSNNTKQPKKKINKTLPQTISTECYEPVCFVPSCKTPKGLPLYNFPFGDKRLLDIWAERTGLSTLYDTELYLTITICKNHFHENCFHDNSIQLKPYAIPSVNLIDYSGPPDSCCLIKSLHSDENSVMTSTGDRTWGWLGSTEAFGRPPEPNEFIVIPKSEIHCEKYAGSNHAAHCFIYAENNERVFDIYNPRASILMQLRYDGYFGFPGGLIDAGEDFVSAVNREMAEEMNLNTTIHSVNHDDHIISHWSEKKNLVLHFYKLKVNMTDLIEIERQASLARDYGTEVLGTVRVPLYTLGDHYRGFPVFLNHNFIGCSREQLLAALSSLNILTPEEIQLALNANSRNI